MIPPGQRAAMIAVARVRLTYERTPGAALGGRRQDPNSTVPDAVFRSRGHASVAPPGLKLFPERVFDAELARRSTFNV
jgi:hypothetical protein